MGVEAETQSVMVSIALATHGSYRDQSHTPEVEAGVAQQQALDEETDTKKHKHACNTHERHMQDACKMHVHAGTHGQLTRHDADLHRHEDAGKRRQLKKRP